MSKQSSLVLNLFATMIFLGFVVSLGVGCSSDPDGESGEGLDDVGIDGDADFDVPPFEANICGGDGEVLEYDGEPAAPGETCGECHDGVLVCDGEDALECIGASQKNACGGCGELPAEPDTSCGPCDDGVWSCDGEDSLVCEEATERNRCGGCEELEQTPGMFCDAGEKAGVFRCTHVDTVECISAGQNACGGDSALEALPTTPCGECNQGVTVCDGTEDVMCHDEEAGQNACGGCAPLRGVPETSCGFCGGEWYCADDDLSVCDDSSRNLCGGCVDLSGELDGAMPGDECGDEGQVWTCRSLDEIICPDEVTNACGGSEELDALPGETCGECGDGLTICTSPDSVICHGATESNECGGCGILPGEEGEECGLGATWECTDDGSMRCKLDEEEQVNACGGTEVLDGVLGQPCGPCDLDVLVCDGENALVCSGDTACPDLVVDQVTVSDVEENSASFEAELVDLPAAAVTEHGFCWSDEQDPEGDDDHCESLGEATEAGTFSMDVEELLPGTEYHVVAFATVDEQTTTTEEISFWTKAEAPQVTATVDLQEQVALSWESVEGAEHYLVTRDGVAIDEVDADDTSFIDMGAHEAPAPDAPQITNVSDDLMGGIEVVWDEASVQPGTLHEYAVIAVNADELESDPGTAEGRRAAYEIDEYEICIGANCDDGDWTELESPQGTTADLSYLDTTAPLATIEGGSAQASEGEFEDFVRLVATGWQIEDAEERAYQVRAVSEAGTGEASNAESGRRATEELHYEWFASALDASGNFTSLYGPATDADTYDDTQAPEDGSDRHYYVRLSADGAAPVEYPGTDNPLVGFITRDSDAVVTLSAENVGTNSATLRGRLNHLGNPPAVEVGLCWDRFQPAEDGNCVAVEPMVDEGEVFETTVQTLGSGRQYYVRAYLEDEDGHRTYGEHRSFTTRPGTPSGVETTNTPEHVEISWDSVRGATSYRIIRDGSVIGTTSSTSYEDDGIEAGSLKAAGEIEVGAAEVYWRVALKSDEATTDDGDTAEYQVQAFNSTGEGGISGSVSGHRIVDNLRYIWQFYDAQAGDEDCTGGSFEDVQDVDCSDIAGRNCTDQNDMEGGDIRCYRMKVSADGAADDHSDPKSYSACDPDASPFGGGDGSSEKPHLLCTPQHLNAVGDSDSSDTCQEGDQGNNCLDDHFRMVADINMADLLNQPDVEFNIIGDAEDQNDSENAFKGTFDGGGHIIENLKIHRSGDSYVALIGLFHGQDNGEIKNVGLEYVDIEGNNSVAGLVGHNRSGTISQSYATGSVDGSSGVGGLAGYNSGDISTSYASVSVDGSSYVGGLVGWNTGDISESYATGYVDGSHYWVGGLVGLNYMGATSDGEISESYASVSVEGFDRVGGLVGENRRGTISESYATGPVEGYDNFIGGLVGENHDEISESYATGSVEGNNWVGGLVGENRDEISESYATGSVDGRWFVGGLVGSNGRRATISDTFALGVVKGDEFVGGLVGLNGGDEAHIEHSYSAGPVSLKPGSDSTEIGGLIGRNLQTVKDSYWDTKTSGHEEDDEGVGVDDGTTENVEGLETDDFSDEEKFSDEPFEWDFDDIWTIGTAPAPDSQERPIFQRDIIDGCNPHASPFGGGDGSDGDPHLLCAPQHLNAVGDSASEDACQNDDCLDDHFRMVTDIDMEEFLEDEDFNIIGDADSWLHTVNAFKGSFDGGGHVIKNLKIHQSNENLVALFGIFDGGEKGFIKDVGIDGVDIKGNNYSAGLVGYVHSGIISESYVTGTVDGNERFAGGLVARNGGAGEISASHASVAVDGNRLVGGLVGLNSGTISKSYATGFVNGQHNVGGLVGTNGGVISGSYATGSVVGDDSSTGGLVGANDGEISGSYATGSVAANDASVGGLVGHNWRGTISETYALGDVNGDAAVGGLVGFNSGDDASIEHSYSAGQVSLNQDSNSTEIGGLIGRNEETVRDSYWDTKTSGQDEDGVGSQSGTIDNVEGLTTGQFSNEAEFSGEWNFNETWTIGRTPAPDDNERPVFQWQNE